jgi:hypothetical protein
VIARLIGVYNAEGSLRGELAYLLGKLTGRAHCALCDITHGALRRHGHAPAGGVGDGHRVGLGLFYMTSLRVCVVTSSRSPVMMRSRALARPSAAM